jgi:uncharacterized protein (TIGR00369 family)
MNVTAPQPAADPAAVLAEWQAREAFVLGRIRERGVSRPDQVASLSGMQMLQAMLDGDLPCAPIFETLDFILVEVENGRAVFQGWPLYRHYNPLGGVHGGWFATLLDSALGCAVHSTLGAGRGYTTAELKLNIVRPLSDKIVRVRAEGKVIHLGKRMATAEARMTGPDGKLYAHATTTCFLFDTP